MKKNNWDDSFWHNDAESMAILIQNKTGGLEGYQTEIEEKPVVDDVPQPNNSRSRPSLIRGCLSFLRWIK